MEDLEKRCGCVCVKGGGGRASHMLDQSINLQFCSGGQQIFTENKE